MGSGNLFNLFILDPGVVPGEQVFYFGLVEMLIFSKKG
jgi:hypothetical protein